MTEFAVVPDFRPAGGPLQAVLPPPWPNASFPTGKLYQQPAS
jgi:hypothetical protein